MYFPFNPRGFQIGDIIKKKKKKTEQNKKPIFPTNKEGTQCCAHSEFVEDNLKPQLVSCREK